MVGWIGMRILGRCRSWFRRRLLFRAGNDRVSEDKIVGNDMIIIIN